MTDKDSELSIFDILSVVAMCHPVVHNSAVALTADCNCYSSGAAIADDSSDYSSGDNRCDEFGSMYGRL